MDDWVSKGFPMICRGFCKYKDCQNNYLHEAREKPGSRLSSQCWFKLQESDTGQLILGIFKYRTILGEEVSRYNIILYAQ